MMFCSKLKACLPAAKGRGCGLTLLEPCLLTLLLAPLVLPARAAELISSDGTAFDTFGGSVSLSGRTAVVGAVFDDIGSSSGQGSAYLYRNLDTAFGTTTENSKLQASDGAAGDFFGASVQLGRGRRIFLQVGVSDGHERFRML